MFIIVRGAADPSRDRAPRRGGPGKTRGLEPPLFWVDYCKSPVLEAHARIGLEFINGAVTDCFGEGAETGTRGACAPRIRKFLMI